MTTTQKLIVAAIVIGGGVFLFRRYRRRFTDAGDDILAGRIQIEEFENKSTGFHAGAQDPYTWSEPSSDLIDPYP